MNYLFISQTDLKYNIQKPYNNNIPACLSGARAIEAIEDHDLKSGIKISCVVEGVGRGKVDIVSCASGQVELIVQVQEELPPRSPVDLAVAYSRPQTIKKLVHLASSLGVRSLSFVKTQNVVGSYLQSKSLHNEVIKRHLILGCEQAGDGVFPQLNFFTYFHDFINSDLVSSRSDQKFFGQAAAKSSQCETCTDALLFLGPESGFSVEEVRDLESYGFKALSLGSRMLRVEIAAAMLLAKMNA